MRVAGIDGTKGGWVAIVLRDGRFERAELIRPIQSTFEEFADVDVIAIDVPIGFGPRQADTAAREFLKGSASSVFSMPRREVLEGAFGPGLGVSAQAHALGPRVIHVTSLAVGDQRLREVHPEVSFRAMNAGSPIGLRKKSAGGALARLALLSSKGIDLGDLGSAAAAPLDDVLDAGAAAWSAQRIADGTARCLPETPELADGVEVAIWY